MAQHWEAPQGAPVRVGKALTTASLGRLGAGAVVTETAKEGERLHFKKVSGTGPDAGWVSVKLLAKADGPKAQEKPAFMGKSLLAVAEATVISDGPAKALKEATEKGKDGAAMIVAAVAYLTSGKPVEGFNAAMEARNLLSSNKEAEASAILTMASASLAQGDPREALTSALRALELFKEARDKQMEASALCTAANARIFLKALPDAIASAKEALAIFQELGDIEGERAAEMTLSDALVAQDGTEKAARVIAEEKLAYFRSKGDAKGEGETLKAMANVETNMAEAARLSKRAAHIFQMAKDAKSQASALQIMAAACLRQGESGEAVKAAEESLQASDSVGDKRGQVSALNVLSNAYTAQNKYTEALDSSARAQALCKELGDKVGEANALHMAAAAHLAKGDAAEALKAVQAALDIFKAEGDKQGEAAALQTGVSVCLTKGGSEAQKDALKMAKETLALLRLAGDSKGEAMTLYTIASIRLSIDGGAMDALTAADRARSIFLVLGDKKYQGLASHIVAKANLMMGELDFAMQSAMQAVVLAREAGDKLGEAAALHTGTNVQLGKGRLAEGLRMAKEVEVAFKAAGSKEGEAAALSMIERIQEAIPARTPVPRTLVQPMDDARLAGQRSLFQEHPNCVIWTPPVNTQTYVMFCLELLKLVDDLKNVSSNTALLIATQGSYGRQMGEPIPSKMEGVTANTVWATVRTIRLESPRLHIASVDVPVGATSHEITEIMRAAQIDSGSRNEVCYFMDRRERFGKT